MFDTDPVYRIKFIFPGVGKCGTTWIYNFLSVHPAVATPRIKEPYLLDVEPAAQQGMIRDLYPHLDRPLCDFSNTYYRDEANPMRVHQHNPGAKVVVTVRRPSDRVWSHYRFLRQHNREGWRTLAEYFQHGDTHDLVERSNYAPVIARYRAVLGPQAVDVLPLELLSWNAQVYADHLTSILAIPNASLRSRQALPAMAAAKPRSRVAVATARRVADQMRQSGHLRALGRLKTAAALQRLLFAEVEPEPVPYDQLPRELVDLDSSYAGLLSREGYEDNLLDAVLSH